MSDEAEERRPFWVRCSDCEHVWVALWLPMPAAKAGRMLEQASCPKCAAPAARIFGSDPPVPSKEATTP